MNGMCLIVDQRRSGSGMCQISGSYGAKSRFCFLFGLHWWLVTGGGSSSLVTGEITTIKTTTKKKQKLRCSQVKKKSQKQKWKSGNTQQQNEHVKGNKKGN